MPVQWNFLREAAEICLRTSLIFIPALLREFTPKWHVKESLHHYLSNFKEYSNQLFASKQSLRKNMYLVTYICSGLEDLCISVIGICCAGCLGFRVLSLASQKFGLYFFITYYILFQLNLKVFKVWKSVRENLAKSLTH